MTRANRIYLAIDKNGKPVLARTVKYEMRFAIKELERIGIDTDNYKYWSVPDGSRNEIKEINKSFFTQEI